MVKDDQKALMVRQNLPFTAFEITQPDAVSLCREYLVKIANRIGYTGHDRAKIISQIKKRIQELQD